MSAHFEESVTYDKYAPILSKRPSAHLIKIKRFDVYYFLLFYFSNQGFEMSFLFVLLFFFGFCLFVLFELLVGINNARDKFVADNVFCAQLHNFDAVNIF